MFLKKAFGAVLLSVMAGCTQVEEQVVSTLLRSYVDTQEALAADNLGQAQQAVASLSSEQDAEIKDLVEQITKAESIDDFRAKFKLLSEKVAAAGLPKGYVEAFCPMAFDGQGAIWIQKDGDIKNPYFGSKMLKCGTVQKKGS